MIYIIVVVKHLIIFYTLILYICDLFHFLVSVWCTYGTVACTYVCMYAILPVASLYYSNLIHIQITTAYLLSKQICIRSTQLSLFDSVVCLSVCLVIEQLHIITINIKDWTLWSVPSPELQLLLPTLLGSSNCSPSLWSVAVWFQRDSVLWHSLQVWRSVPSVFICLV
jgi:hypothetical protein